MQASPLIEILALSIKRLQYRNYRAADARLAPLGISLVQWGALREIERNPGVCMHHLAELTFNSDQAFGTLMIRLLRQKLVERQPGAGRANLHRLTPKGKTLLEQGRRCVHQVFCRNFAALDADEHALLQRLLTKVLGDGGLDAAPRAVVAKGRPPAKSAKTPAGVTASPAGGSHDKKTTRHPASVRSRKTN